MVNDANTPYYFTPVEPSGDCKQYAKGDMVIRGEKTYIAKDTPIPCLPPENKNSGWKEVGPTEITSITCYNSTNAPETPNEGDEWFNPNTGRLYKYLKDTDSSQWVQIF
jgi:hypothetical protein